MLKTCPVCSRRFDAPPSGSVTCSRACGGAMSGRSRVGKPHKWGVAAKRRLSARGQTPNLKAGTPAARLSPVAGPYETNQEAKVWHLRNVRTRAEYRVTNLHKFCRDNPGLFTPTPWQRAYAGLRQVQASLTGKTPRAVTRYKDWTLTEPAHAP